MESPDRYLSGFLDPRFPQKYPQAWWKSFDSFRDGNLAGEAAKSPFQSGWKRFPTATSGFGSSKASRRRAHCHLALTSSDTTASSRRVRGNPGRSRLLSHQHRPPRTGGVAGRDSARQPFTISNHLVEILPHSRRGRICLEHPGSRRCCAIVLGGLSLRWPAIRNLFKIASVHLQLPMDAGHTGRRAEVSQCSRIAAPRVHTPAIRGDPRLSRLPPAPHRLVGRSLEL